MSRLVMHTRELLINRPRTLTYEDLARKAEVTVFWLDRFANGRSNDFPCGKVERLYELLSGKSLKL